MIILSNTDYNCNDEFCLIIPREYVKMYFRLEYSLNLSLSKIAAGSSRLLELQYDLGVVWGGKKLTEDCQLNLYLSS